MRIIANSPAATNEYIEKATVPYCVAQQQPLPAFIQGGNVLQPPILESASTQTSLLARASSSSTWLATSVDELPDSAIELPQSSRRHVRMDSKVDNQHESKPRSTLADVQYVRLPVVAFVPSACLFVKHLFPFIPILGSEFRHCTSQCITHARLDRALYSLLCALAALTAVTLRSHFRLSHVPFRQTSRWFAESSIREFAHIDLGGHADQSAIRTTYLLSAYHWQLEQSDLAWYYLNESITLIQISGFDEETAYTGLNEQDAMEWRRLYWTVFMLERRQAKRRHERLRLRTSVLLPVAEWDDTELLLGFYANAKLLSRLQVDHASYGCPPPAADIPWLVQSLEVVREVRQLLDRMSFLQRITAWTTCMWTQLHAWQSTSPGLVSGGNADVPMQLLGEICEILCTLEPSAIESLGVDVYLDTIDIVTTVIERLTMASGVPMVMWTGKMQSIYRFVAWIQHAESRPVKAFARLQIKMQALQQAYSAVQQGSTQLSLTAESLLDAWISNSVMLQEEATSPLTIPMTSIEANTEDARPNGG